MTKLLSVRLVAILVGLGFALIALYSFVVGAYAAITEEAAGHVPYEKPEDIAYSFDGPFGKWDIQQLQRGFKVYDEVCAACVEGGIEGEFETMYLGPLRRPEDRRGVDAPRLRRQLTS